MSEPQQRSEAQNGPALAGRVAVVTGGGRGIGAAVARELAALGATVAVAARTESEIESVAAELRGGGHRAMATVCDVRDEAAVAVLRREVEEALGPVDVLVNNAGIASSATVARTTLEEWNRIFAINATGTFLCTRELMPGMLERGWGRVVNVASIAGLTGDRYMAAYAASKHAVIGLTRCAAAEAAAQGVTVNAVCPGYVDTPMTDQSVARMVEKTGMDETRARGYLEKTNPQGRLVTPEEVAHAVASLCHPRASAINGEALLVDGGALRR